MNNKKISIDEPGKSGHLCQTGILLIMILFSPGLIVSQVNEKVNELIEKGEYLTKNENLDSAMYFFDSALLLANDLEAERIQTSINQVKGKQYLAENKLDSAEYYFNLYRSKVIPLEQIIKVSDTNGKTVVSVNEHHDSVYYIYKSKFDQYVTNDDSLGIASSAYALSLYFKNIIRYDTSFKYGFKSYKIFLKKNDNKSLAKSLIHIGDIYSEYDKPDSAFHYYDSAYVVASEHKIINLATLAILQEAKMFESFGYINKRNGNIEQSNKFFYSAIKLYNQLLTANFFDSPIVDKLQLYNSLSYTYENVDSINKAIIYAEKAASLPNDNVNLQFGIKGHLANLYFSSGNNEEALKNYLNNYSFAKRQIEHIGLFDFACRDLIKYYESIKDFNSALIYANSRADYYDSLWSAENRSFNKKSFRSYQEIEELKYTNQINQLKKDQLHFERNVFIATSVLIVLLLISIVIYLRMRNRKNRIIAEQRIQKLEDEKKLLAAQSVMVGQEKERERIARELHDGIGVLLSTASIHFTSIERKINDETADLLKKANKLLQEAHKEVRQISHNMMPGVLTNFGLKEAIHSLFENVEESGEISIGLDLTCGEERLPQNMEIMIYRVIQEMLNNTLKHARATKITFKVNRRKDLIKMEFRDNGVGFDEIELPHGKNLGLSGIRSRVEYLGGKVEMKSGKDKGTFYLITIPVNE